MLSTNHAELLDAAIDAITRLRESQIVVHCLTNTVAQTFTANLLLAAGATPSMTVSPKEVEAFTSRSDAVLLNLGTLDADRQKAMELSASLCAAQNKPFVLDPVMCHLSPVRLAFAKNVLELGPRILRINESESKAIGIAELFDICPVCVVTGPQDTIYSAENTLRLANGHEWLSTITATGCAQGALMAALLPVARDIQIAALAAIVWINIAGEMAAGKSDGPGSFMPAFIDHIHAVTPADILQRAKIR